ncbi:MAG: hypothetical protein LBJ62_02175 [Bifidobacteriaceae bacterium]|nr:hypothetical protein [Bifidobacteriaceae bacterium]
MLRSSPTGGFNPNIWIGPANSTLARLWVKGTYVSAVNGAVALSAAHSGQHAGLYSGTYCAYVPVGAIGTAHGFAIATG